MWLLVFFYFKCFCIQGTVVNKMWNFFSSRGWVILSPINSDLEILGVTQHWKMRMRIEKAICSLVEQLTKILSTLYINNKIAQGAWVDSWTLLLSLVMRVSVSCFSPLITFKPNLSAQ
jgi:hypothetical protein